MNQTALAGAMIIVIIMAIALAFYWGYYYAKDNSPFKNIDKYINKNFPDKWAAYKKGAHEGYEQGLRDGQDNLE